MQTPPHRACTGTDLAVLLLWGRMASIVRTQHWPPPTLLRMRNKIRGLMESGTQLVSPTAQGRWECTKAKISGLVLMMDTVESGEDSGPPYAAGGEPSPTMSPLSHPPMTLCCSSHALFKFTIGICSSSFMLMIVSRPRPQLAFPASPRSIHRISPFPQHICLVCGF